MMDMDSSSSSSSKAPRKLSLKDRLKRRREAIGNILQQVQVHQQVQVNLSSPEQDAAGPKRVRSEEESHPCASRSSESMSLTPNSSSEVFNLLNSQSAKEREVFRRDSEILELLNRPTAKEQSLMAAFRSHKGGGNLKQFCAHATKKECIKVNPQQPCHKLHFVKIIQGHTDESLGDCSFLNTCFHMSTCKYVHYEVDLESPSLSGEKEVAIAKEEEVEEVDKKIHGLSGHLVLSEKHPMVSPQWVQCDLRNFDLSILGKFSVVMADPPWDIHMELPYGTMDDDEMRRLPVPILQDEGLIFLWVTGRAMELGRECLKLWGYERVDELIWVKTNQLQRIIRTGRTGHWLNHGKEHCLVGAKGNIQLNRGLDCDVLVSEVRATSHKPDEIYGLIERLSPGSRKVELFGRPHNAQPNWITLGNQLDGVLLHDEAVLNRWLKVYPKGYRLNKETLLMPRKTQTHATIPKD